MTPFSKVFTLLFFHHVLVISLTALGNLNTLEFLGLNFSLGATLFLIKNTSSFFYTNWIGRLLGHNANLRDFGSWAVVTGATDGIGLAYCDQLAKQGINIVLISRSIDKLNNCARRLEKLFTIKTIVIEMDFSGEVDKYERIFSQLQGLEIGTLINNVGMTYPRPTRFDEIFNKPNFVRDIINLNVLAVTMMTGKVLPGMIQRGNGAIINVGSVFSFTGGPYFTLYSSTKSYMEQFTSDLANEFRDTGVIFQYQCPGYVATKMSRFRPNFAIPTAEQYVTAGIKLIGLTEKTPVWIVHRGFFFIGEALMNCLPSSMFQGVVTEATRGFWLFAKKRELEKQNVLFLTPHKTKIIV